MDSPDMLKRGLIILIVSAGAVAVIWLAPKTKPTAREQVKLTDELAQQAIPASEEPLTGTEVPESKRHAADVIEKHRQAAPSALDRAILNQEAKLEERRKVLATIVRTKGIIYQGRDSSYNQKDADQDKAQPDAMQVEAQISSLLKYDNEQLMVYAAGLDLPDNNIKVLYPQYMEARRELEEIKGGGLGETHPTWMAQTELTQELLRQLDEAVVKLRATLQAQSEMVKEEAIKRGRDAQDYVDAKRDFETDEKLLQEMKLKQRGRSE